MTTSLDLHVLDSLANHDAAKIRKYALLFLQSMDDVLAQIEVAIDNKDIPQLGAMGHRAKSTALNVGAAEFSHQCMLLEQASQNHDSSTALAIAQTLRPLFGPLRAAITLHIAN